jgi:TPR repeat protein
VAKDPVQAVSWWRKAAEQGYADAQSNLGVAYHYGQGVIKNEIEAYAYYNLAGITSEGARKNLAVLENEITSDARLLGQQRTIQLQKEIEGRLETAQDLLDAIRKEKLREGI